MITKAQIKHIRSLQQKKYRDIHDEFVVEGLHIVREAIKFTPEDIVQLIYTRNSLPDIKEQVEELMGKSIEVSPTDFARLSSQKAPQELLAIIKINHQAAPVPKTNELMMVLDQVQDPGNLGTIIRLADWFGIRNLVCSDNSANCYNPKVVQSSMGGIFRVNVCYTNLKSYLEKLKEKGNITIYGTLMEGSDLYTSSLKLPGIIVMGNEAHGISTEIIELLDHHITIPNFSTRVEKTESLNVAIAAAITCSEFRRRRKLD